MNTKSNFFTSLIQFIKFNIVGLFNTTLTYGVYSLMVFLTNNYIFALLVDYAVGIAISFILNKIITFKNKDKITFFMVFKMILSYIPSLLINLVLLHIFVDKLLWNKYLAQLIVAGIIAIISYFLMQKFV